MTTSEMAALRRELSRHEKGRGRRYPAKLRERVTRYCLERRSAGGSDREVAAELGLAVETVRRWCLAEEERVPSAVLVPVEVVTAPMMPLAIVSPSGFRLEGLQLEEAVAALRALR